MRIAVFGATGRTGRSVVDQALGAGHEVAAVSRGANALTARPGLQVFPGDVGDRDVVASALDECDAVVSALGIGTSRVATDVYSRGVDNLLAVLSAQGRLTVPVAVVSAAPVGSSADHPLVTRLVVLPILRRVFGRTYADMRRMEGVLSASAAAWVVLRPPRLVAGPAAAYRLVPAGSTFGGRTVSTCTLARALLDSVAAADRHRRAWYVS